MASSHSTSSTTTTTTTATAPAPALQTVVICPSCHYEQTGIRSLHKSVQDQTCAMHVAAYMAELRQRKSAKTRETLRVLAATT